MIPKVIAPDEVRLVGLERHRNADAGLEGVGPTTELVAQFAGVAGARDDDRPPIWATVCR